MSKNITFPTERGKKVAFPFPFLFVRKENLTVLSISFEVRRNYLTFIWDGHICSLSLHTYTVDNKVLVKKLERNLTLIPSK